MLYTSDFFYLRAWDIVVVTLALSRIYAVTGSENTECGRCKCKGELANIVTYA